MKLHKAGIYAIVTVIIMALTTGGCRSGMEQVVKQPSTVEKPASVAEKPAAAKNVPMLLKFVQGDTTQYKVVMQGGRTVKWEGSVPSKPGFQSGQTTSGAEITFTQKIDDVNSNGNAVATITIDGLKYVSKTKESTILDFDSSRATDANHPMAKLIGRSYKIELTPSGQVSRIVDVNSALDAVKGNSSAQRAAMRLLDAEVIKDRHGTLSLPADKNQISSGENWKNVKTFPFGWMGTLSYERVFTLKAVENEAGRSMAVVEMKAIPTSETEKDKNQTTNRIAKSFDNKGTYKGELKFDASSGKVEKFTEELAVEWVSAKPPTDTNTPQAEPTALTMSANRFYSIEKIK